MAPEPPASPRPPGGPAGTAPGGLPRSGVVGSGGPGAVDAQALRAAVLADARSAWRLEAGAEPRISVEAVTWSDGSLGCPVPGTMYTQALVPGWRLVVRDAGRELVYHASRNGHWVQCPAGRARAPAPGNSTH